MPASAPSRLRWAHTWETKDGLVKRLGCCASGSPAQAAPLPAEASACRSGTNDELACRRAASLGLLRACSGASAASVAVLARVEGLDSKEGLLNRLPCWWSGVSAGSAPSLARGEGCDKKYGLSIRLPPSPSRPPASLLLPLAPCRACDACCRGGGCTPVCPACCAPSSRASPSSRAWAASSSCPPSSGPTSSACGCSGCARGCSALRRPSRRAARSGERPPAHPASGAPPPAPAPERGSMEAGHSPRSRRCSRLCGSPSGWLLIQAQSRLSGTDPPDICRRW